MVFRPSSLALRVGVGISEECLFSGQQNPSIMGSVWAMVHGKGGNLVGCVVSHRSDTNLPGRCTVCVFLRPPGF